MITSGYDLHLGGDFCLCRESKQEKNEDKIG